METLKPQFTPGQVMLSPSPALSGSTTGINMMGGTNNVSLLQQEVENLREQLKDWQEKYETIMGNYFHLENALLLNNSRKTKYVCMLSLWKKITVFHWYYGSFI